MANRTVKKVVINVPSSFGSVINEKLHLGSSFEFLFLELIEVGDCYELSLYFEMSVEGRSLNRILVVPANFHFDKPEVLDYVGTVATSERLFVFSRKSKSDC